MGGQAERLRLVTDRFPGALDAFAAFVPRSRQAELTDALDALAALDSALRVRAGNYKELGGETDDVGLVMRMVF